MAHTTSVNTMKAMLCAHCRSVVPLTRKSQFCCSGCESVYSLLHDRSLQDFYLFKDRSTTPAHDPFLNKQKFEHLDSTEFISEYSYQSNKVMYFYLEGVQCAACIWLTEKLPNFTSGVKYLSLNLSTSIAKIEIDEGGSFSLAAFELSKLGYIPRPVKLDAKNDYQKNEDKKHLIRIAIAGMSAGNIMLLAIGVYAGATPEFSKLFNWISLFLFLPVITYSAFPFYKNAWGSFKNKHVSIDIPIVIGTLIGATASIIGVVLNTTHIYFDSISSLIFLLLSSRYLIRKINQSASNSQNLLHSFLPRTVNTVSNLNEINHWNKVDLQSVIPGQILRVFPHEIIPVDGVICNGETHINHSLVTGEARSQKTIAGQSVLAGTLNIEAPVNIKVTASGLKTRLSKILKTMEETLLKKSPTIELMDLVGKYFVYTVLFIALIAFFVGIQTNFETAIYRVLAIVIVVCPCTFAFATPLAMSLALKSCSKFGVFVKNASVIESLSKIKGVIFDKTGTLTESILHVTSFNEIKPNTASIVLSLESKSSHPIAQAVVGYLKNHNTLFTSRKIIDFKEILGKGLYCKIDNKTYTIEAIRSKNLNILPLFKSQESIIGVYEDNSLITFFTVSNKIRDCSSKTIKELKNLSLQVYILSGDNSNSVADIANKVNVHQDQVYSSSSPEKKLDIVTQLNPVLMVGDGINDAIAIAGASVGYAVNGGIEICNLASSIFSAQPKISKIPDLILLSRETMYVIKRNLIFSVFYNVIGIIAAFMGFVSPLFAAILMPMSAISVFVSTLIGTPALRKIRSTV